MSPLRQAEQDPAVGRGAGSHVRLAGDRWAMWPHISVRSAGFPARGVLRLRAPELIRLADGLLAEGDVAGAELDGFRSAYHQAGVELERRLQEIAGQRRFRTAVAWQNHHAFASGIEPLLRHRAGVDPRNSQHRQHEEMVASYWQRYCTKNDTIGHFGPVGWALLGAADATTYSPGSTLIESHEVFFESWAVDRVAERLAAEEGMAEWLPPRRIPFLGLTDTAVLPPHRPAVAVSPAVVGTLRLCDGVRPAREVSREAVRLGLVDQEADGYAMLRDLVKRRWLVWTLELPAGPRPERDLRTRLERVGSAPLRERALAQLDLLEQARGQVAGAWDDADRLLPALHHLDVVFTQIVGGETVRNKGKMYGGRTLVYHDSRRALRARFGADLLAAMAPIDLILTSAAWLTHTVGQELNTRIRAAYEALANRLPRPVDLGSLGFECLSLVLGPGREIVAAITADLQRRWADILNLPDGVARVSYDAAQLREQVQRAFPAPHSGWEGARHISPDVMVMAADIDAIRRGDFQVVLAEIHLALIAYRHWCFVTQHPDRAQLLRCIDTDFPQPRLLAVLPKDNSARLTVRTHPALTRDEDFLVALSHHTVDPGRPRLLLSADLPVEVSGDRLVVRLPSGERFDVIESFAELLVDLVMDAYEMFARAGHLPRISFDRLVVQRECWWFDVSALTFARLRDEAQRFLQIRAWHRSARLPTQVFISSPVETKPFYVDFDSPTYVNIFAKAIRRIQAADPVGRIGVTEMLPTPDQLWLTDADGERYTSELRMVAVDTWPVDWAGQRDAATVPSARAES